MFDDSKRLDALEAWRKDVDSWQRGTTKVIEEIGKASSEYDKASNKSFEAINKTLVDLAKVVETFNKNFVGIWNRLDALEKSVGAHESALKKAKLK